MGNAASCTVGGAAAPAAGVVGAVGVVVLATGVVVLATVAGVALALSGRHTLPPGKSGDDDAVSFTLYSAAEVTPCFLAMPNHESPLITS